MDLQLLKQSVAMPIIALATLFLLLIFIKLAAKRFAADRANGPILLDGFEAVGRLMSESEYRFFSGLKNALGSGFSIFSKVRLEDIIGTKKTLDAKTRMSCRNRVKSRHIDFLVCSPVDSQILAGIELDDSSHQRSDRRKRDAFVNDLFESCKVPLIRVKAAAHYDYENILTRISEYEETPIGKR